MMQEVLSSPPRFGRLIARYALVTAVLIVAGIVQLVVDGPTAEPRLGWVLGSAIAGLLLALALERSIGTERSESAHRAQPDDPAKHLMDIVAGNWRPMVPPNLPIVLGAPGSGKTTLIALLRRQAVERRDHVYVSIANDDVTTLLVTVEARVWLLKRQNIEMNFPAIAIGETVLKDLRNLKRRKDAARGWPPSAQKHDTHRPRK